MKLEVICCGGARARSEEGQCYYYYAVWRARLKGNDEQYRG